MIDLAVEHHFDRSSVITLGRVIGDLGGFVAAIYQQGSTLCRFRPPSWLWLTAVGGKVAVIIPAKNMIGAFHQRAGLIDTATLRPCPPGLSLGLAETVKYGIIADVTFAYLQENAGLINRRDETVLQHAIRRSCEIKAAIVEDDERESGVRAILNLGHTFGHAIETCCGYGTYRHGEAVAMGIVLAARLAHRLNLLDTAEKERILALMDALGLNLPIPNLPPQKWLNVMSRTKVLRTSARSSSTAIGQVVIRMTSTLP